MTHESESVYQHALRYAQTAYEAYRTYQTVEERMGLSPPRPLPPSWEELSPIERQPWFAAAQAIEDLTETEMEPRQPKRFIHRPYFDALMLGIALVLLVIWRLVR